MSTHPKQQRGYTLLELSASIAGMLVLAAIAVGYGASANARARNAQLIAQVTAVNDAVRAQYPAAFLYTGVSISQVWNSIAGSARGASATPLNQLIAPWPGAVITLAPLANAAGRNTRYAITVSSLPTQACMALLTSQSANYAGIATNGTVRKQNSLAALSGAAITTACAGASADADPTNIQLING